ncbi:MAG: 2-oxo acid dehydrogenase subunit E2, partial [Bifidobacteriaceae bacterium]|nr:2-oxo acid dehydrogenase subunit E2 [Bifidobacteriaceae bacterium]
MIEITMPRLSDTMQEGAIAAWQVKPGDQVSPGDVLAEIETDKAVMDFEAYDAGTITELLVEPGQAVSIGQPIALLDDGSADQDSAEQTGGDQASADEPGERDADRVPDNRAPHAVPAEPVLASPLVRRMARDQGVDLRRIQGSGPGGRIIRVDLERVLADHNRLAPGAAKGSNSAGDARAQTAAQDGLTATTTASSTGQTAAVDQREPTAVPVSQLRRTIARRLTESAQQIPVFTLTLPIRVDALLDLRAQMNQHLAVTGRGKVSVNDLVVKASALALREYPAVNASWAEDSILLHG